MLALVYVRTLGKFMVKAYSLYYSRIFDKLKYFIKSIAEWLNYMGTEGPHSPLGAAGEAGAIWPREKSFNTMKIRQVVFGNLLTRVTIRFCHCFAFCHVLMSSVCACITSTIDLDMHLTEPCEFYSDCMNLDMKDEWLLRNAIMILMNQCQVDHRPSFVTFLAFLQTIIYSASYNIK